MNKKVFDPALFREGLRQMKLAGIVLFVVSVILNVLPPVIGWSSYASNKLKETNAAFTVSINSLAPIYILFFYLVPIILVMILFGAMHRRNGSDFYHSLPYTRGSLFISFGAAVLAVFTVITVVSVLLPSALYVMLGATLIPVYIPQVLFTYLAGGALVTAVMLLAMSLTGTPIANLVVAALILLLPRGIIALFVQAITNSLPIISVNDFGFIGNTAYNIPANFFYMLFGSFFGHTTGYSDSLFMAGGTLVYTFVLAAVYLVLGWLAFRARKSESAGFTAPNRILQHVYRCAFTLPVAVLIPFYMIYNTQSGDRTTYIVLGIVAVIVYFLFELVSTKKLKNLLTAAPFLLVLVAIDVALGFGALGVRNQVLNQTVSADQIQSVSIQLNASTGQYYSETDGYNDILTRGIVYTNDEVKKQVAADLDYAVQTLQKSLRQNGGNYYISAQINYRAVIHTKNGQTITRYLVSDGEHQGNTLPSTTDVIAAAMRKNEKFEALSTVLPAEAQIKNVSIYAGDGTLSVSQAKKFWAMYRAEFDQLTDAQRAFLILGNGVNANARPVFEIDLNGTYQSQYFYNHYAVTSLTPKTANAMIAFTNMEQNIQKVKSKILENDNGKNIGVNLTVYNAKPAVSGIPQTFSFSFSGSRAKVFYNIVQQEFGKPVDAASLFAKVDCEGSTAFLPLTTDDLAKLDQYGFLS